MLLRAPAGVAAANAAIAELEGVQEALRQQDVAAFAVDAELADTKVRAWLGAASLAACWCPPRARLLCSAAAACLDRAAAAAWCAGINASSSHSGLQRRMAEMPQLQPGAVPLHALAVHYTHVPRMLATLQQPC